VEPLNPFPKDEAEDLIRKTVAVLDRYGKLYEKLSGGLYGDYTSYMASAGFADEDEFVKPKLFTDFLKEVLGFPADAFLPEHARPSGVPDFQPVDVLLHPFFFEVKGSDSLDLTLHEPQVHKYFKGPFMFGAITNMRDILTYDKTGLVMRRVSLLQLYRAAKGNPRDLLERPETRAFLEFVAQFRHQTLDRITKVERIKNAPLPDTLPAIEPDELVASIHTVVRVLTEDARSFARDLDHSLKHRALANVRRKLMAELAEIAGELDQRRAFHLEDDLGRFVNAREGTLERRTFDVFLTRVAYFTMTRFLIARMWEDVGFLEQKLYNGGFAKWYNIQQREIQRVLTEAFAMAGRHYSWLFNESHNYFWYSSPSEDAIIDVLYEFARYNLGGLDTDVLGTVYEQFVDRIDRKNKGQYYTPREVIRFIWDRVGFTTSDAFFRHEGGERQPAQILDVATGSGGFLVEAAYRIRTRTKYNREDADDLLDILHSITGGLCGCEISLFAHYITEVNLLIQLTPIIRDIVKANKHLTDNTRMVTLCTVPGDSLALIGSRALFTNDISVHNRPSETIEHDAKGPTRADLTNSFDFDYVCSNPPYVGEKGHKELFRKTRENIPYWRKYYQGKMDYLYWFIMLGLAKLRTGGKLGFITTSYWPTADGASKLREFILDNALIREIVDFGETRIFEGAPGQHNMVFVLEKLPSMKPTNSHSDGMPDTDAIARKQENRIKVVKVKAVPPADSDDRRPALARALSHIERHIDKRAFEDRYIEVHDSPVRQGMLTDGVWNLFSASGPERLLAIIAERGEPLQAVCSVNCGVQTSADKVSASNLRVMPAVPPKGQVRLGEGIFVLAVDELQALRLKQSELQAVKPMIKNSDVDSYIVKSSDFDDWLIYFGGDTNVERYPGLLEHLERFKPILENREGCNEGLYPWYRLHCPRRSETFEGEKIVSPQRAGSNVFAYHVGPLYASVDVYFTTLNDGTRESLKYICGILNSRLILFWLDNKCKKKGKALELYARPLARIPIKRVDFGNERDVARHDKLVKLVDEMIETKQALAKLNRFFSARLTRMTSAEELPEPDAEAITGSLPDKDLRKVKNHPKVFAKPASVADFVLSKVGDAGSADDLFTTRDMTESSDDSDRVPSPPIYALPLTGKGRKLITVLAPKEIAKYLQGIFSKHIGTSWAELKETPLARGLATYQAKEKAVMTEARSLLCRVAATQSKIDALVYELYGLTEAEIATIEGRTS